MKAITSLVGCALLLGASVASADTLQNDSFMAGGTVVYQAGFDPDEGAAAQLDLPNGNSWKVDKVRFLYGPDAVARNLTLNIHAPTAGAAPGAVLYTKGYTVNGSSDAMVEIDLTAENIIVTTAFRVSLIFEHEGNPSVAADIDGYSDANKSLLLSTALGWTTSMLLGVSGDWIIRADVTEQGGGGGADAGPGGPDAAPGSPDAATSTPEADAGTGAACMLNSDCTLGSYCGDDSTCAIDCRNDIDCTGEQSCEPALGKCEEKSGGGGGCSTSGSSPMGSSTAGLLLLGLLALRRRSRRA